MIARFRRIRAYLHDLWQPPCSVCGSAAATCCEPCARAEVQTLAIPASSARFCLDCEVYFAPVRMECPNCAGHTWILAEDLVRNRNRRRRARHALRELQARRA